MPSDVARARGFHLGQRGGEGSVDSGAVQAVSSASTTSLVSSLRNGTNPFPPLRACSALTNWRSAAVCVTTATRSASSAGVNGARSIRTAVSRLPRTARIRRSGRSRVAVRRDPPRQYRSRRPARLPGYAPAARGRCRRPGQGRHLDAEHERSIQRRGRVFPTPASPATSTTSPCPSRVLASTSSRSASASPRPMTCAAVTREAQHSSSRPLVFSAPTNSSSCRPRRRASGALPQTCRRLPQIADQAFQIRTEVGAGNEIRQLPHVPAHLRNPRWAKGLHPGR